MNPGDKWQEITLMNSKCSQSTIDTNSQLYRAIIKNLKEDKCPLHQQKYEYYYKHHLMCHECFSKSLEDNTQQISPALKKQYENFYHLEAILNHPIILVIDETELFSHPNELMEMALKSYKQLYSKKSDFKIQKQCIDSFITRIKNRVNQLCDKILANFKEMQESICKQSQLREELKNLGVMYEAHLMQMLGENFLDGSKQELQKILQDYSSCNQNPLPKILENLQEMMNAMGSSPFVDTKALAEIYTTVTDERTWRLDKIISTLDQHSRLRPQNADMIVDFDRINLQGQYTLSIKDNEVNLELQGRAIARLEVQLDSVYHLADYRLLGVNYDKLIIINYFDRLEIQKQYTVTGCTDVLPFKDHIIAISNDDLIKINRQTGKYSLLGKGYKNLQYHVSSDIAFICQNQANKTINWVYQAQFLPVSPPFE